MTFEMKYGILTIDEFKKADAWATITKEKSRIERRVYHNQDGKGFVKINGEFISLDKLRTSGHNVCIWF